VSFDEKPEKVHGVVEEVHPDCRCFYARLVLSSGEEYGAWIMTRAWPPDKLKLLVPGRLFTLPGKRHRGIHVIDRPKLTRRQMKKIRRRSRELAKILQEPTEG